MRYHDDQSQHSSNGHATLHSLLARSLVTVNLLDLANTDFLGSQSHSSCQSHSRNSEGHVLESNVRQLQV